MVKGQISNPGLFGPLQELFERIWQALAISLAVFAGVGFVGNKLETPPHTGILLRSLQVAMAGTVFGFVVYASVRDFLKTIQARRANEKVARVFQEIKGTTPGGDVAAISPEQVAARVTDAKVDKEHLERLAERHKQELQIDEESFQSDVRSLIVDYLQLLPRNAKRLLNRFRVNVLIADRRGLFASEPKVTTQQIGKWLVLGERWPQLRLTLSAAPEKIAVLEKDAAASPMPPGDPFMESIATLSPFYAGDEDLRKFIRSEPALAPVLSRLVHYGAETLPPAAAAL